MKNSEKPVSRKTGSLIAKNLIVLSCLVAVCAFAIFSWFTNGKTADASGISIISKADGVEISWDGTDYYKHLTAMDSSGVVEGDTGLAKNITGDANPASLDLVTGNGINFFSPVVNRKNGAVLKNADGSWKGSAVTDSSGKYIDVELYFRALSPFKIFLAGDSAVSPKNPEGNISSFGNFSKDYIAAATRVAFLNAEKNSCSFIWAPNSDIELQESKDGYKKLEETIESVSTGGSDGIPDEILENNNSGKTYNFWLPNDYKEDKDAQLNGMRLVTSSRYETFDGTKGLYVFEFPITFYRPNQTIPFIINENSTLSVSDFGTYIDATQGKAHNYNDSNDITLPTAKFSSGTYNVNSIDGSTTYKTYGIYYSGFEQNSKINVKIGYNPTKKEFIMLGYSGGGSDKEYNRANPTTIETRYYDLSANVNIALANERNSQAISESSSKLIGFKSSGVISPNSISSAEQFTAIKNGDKADATYTFRNIKTGSYLKADSNGIALVGVNKATSFKLVSLEGISGAVLKSTAGELYLVYSNGKFTMVQASDVTANNFVSVFVGTSYALIKPSTAAQPYTFYDSNEKALTNLSSTSTPPLFTSSTSDTESKRIGVVDSNTKYPVATLTKEDGSEYYTAKIVVRIWAEGTDRDALQPLADGLFDVFLHFVPEK